MKELKKDNVTAKLIGHLAEGERSEVFRSDVYEVQVFRDDELVSVAFVPDQYYTDEVLEKTLRDPPTFLPLFFERYDTSLVVAVRSQIIPFEMTLDYMGREYHVVNEIICHNKCKSKVMGMLARKGISSRTIEEAFLFDEYVVYSHIVGETLQPLATTFFVDVSYCRTNIALVCSQHGGTAERVDRMIYRVKCTVKVKELLMRTPGLKETQWVQPEIKEVEKPITTPLMGSFISPPIIPPQEAKQYFPLPQNEPMVIVPLSQLSKTIYEKAKEEETVYDGSTKTVKAGGVVDNVCKAESCGCEKIYISNSSLVHAYYNTVVKMTDLDKVPLMIPRVTGIIKRISIEVVSGSGLLLCGNQQITVQAKVREKGTMVLVPDIPIPIGTCIILEKKPGTIFEVNVSVEVVVTIFLTEKCVRTLRDDRGVRRIAKDLWHESNTKPVALRWDIQYEDGRFRVQGNRAPVYLFFHHLGSIFEIRVVPTSRARKEIDPTPAPRLDEIAYKVLLEYGFSNIGWTAENTFPYHYIRRDMLYYIMGKTLNDFTKYVVAQGYKPTGRIRWGENHILELRSPYVGPLKDLRRVKWSHGSFCELKTWLMCYPRGPSISRINMQGVVQEWSPDPAERIDPNGGIEEESMTEDE